MISKEQIITLQTTRRHAGLDEPAYRLMLRNVADVASCKDLDNVSFEDCMAFLEDHAQSRDTYWRNKVATRGTFANARLVFKINALFAQYQQAAMFFGIPVERQLKLSGLVANATADRTPIVAALRPHEAVRLIEALKDIVARVKPYAPVTQASAPA